MGRGGHHRSSHRHHYHHHRHHYYGSSGGNAPLWVYLLFLGILVAIAFLAVTATYNDIRQGDRINVQCELTDYIYDNADYFTQDDERQIIESLKYFYQETGAQMVIVTQNENISDGGTEKMYYSMFDDEAHVLIVLPMDSVFGENSIQYYYMGDDALNVIDETGMNQMLEWVENGWGSKGSNWSEQIRDITNLIME